MSFTPTYTLCADGKKYIVTPQIDRFDKQTESLINSTKLSCEDLEKVKSWLVLKCGWEEDETLDGGADIDVNNFRSFVEVLNEPLKTPLDFGKYDYQLSFDHKEPK